MKRKHDSISGDHNDSSNQEIRAQPMSTTTASTTPLPTPSIPLPHFHGTSPFNSVTGSHHHHHQQQQQQFSNMTNLFNVLPPLTLPQQLLPNVSSANQAQPASFIPSSGWQATATVPPPQQLNDHWSLSAPSLSSSLPQPYHLQQPFPSHPLMHSQYHQHHHHGQPFPPYQPMMSMMNNVSFPSLVTAQPQSSLSNDEPSFHSSIQPVIIQPERVYEAMDTRFNEIPSEVVSIIIDFIPLGSQTILKFILTNSEVYNTFRNHGYFAYHQFRSSIPSMLQYLCSDNNTSATKEIDKLIALLKIPRNKMIVRPLWERKKEIWKKWAANDCSVAYPESKSVSLPVRQTIYDKLYNLVTFEMLKEKEDDYDGYRITRHAKILIGETIVLTFEGQNSDGGNQVDMTIEYAGDSSSRSIYIENSYSHPYSSGSAGVLHELKEALGLNNIFVDEDDMIDLLLFALPFSWDDLPSRTMMAST